LTSSARAIATDLARVTCAAVTAIAPQTWVTRSRIPSASARQLVRGPRRLALHGRCCRPSSDMRPAHAEIKPVIATTSRLHSAFLTHGESAMFERDAAGLPVRARPSGRREFGSLQWSEHAIWSAADATRRPRRAEVHQSVGGREVTARTVVYGRQLASHCCLVSTGHVSPLCDSTHTTALPEFSTAFQ